MRFFSIIGLMVLLAGCIKNDIPMPVIYGNVQKIEFTGQEKCVINTKTRTIEVTLSDTVDIQNVRLLTLELSADPAREQEELIEATTSPMVDSLFNLSQPYKFVVNTYQEYEWTIVADQPIERYFNVENQVGEAVINVAEKMVRVVVDKNQELSKIKVIDVKLGSSLALYDPEPTELTDFQKQQAIYVTSFGRTERWLVSVFKDTGEDTGNITGSVNAWAKFAYLNGNIPAGENGAAHFEYREARKSNWTNVEADISGKTFSAKVTGLKPKTDYVYRAVVGEQVGPEIAFTTEAAEQVAYSNFDKWYDKTVAGKTAICVGEEGIQVWDTGNEGGAAFGFNPTTEETVEIIKGSAARLQSCWALVKFAAGSVYTGMFAGLDGLNAKLDFGIPYKGRPTTLTGYYKYIPGVVNRLPKNDNRFDHLEGKNDSCHIYVALCDWTEAFHANTKTETLLDCSGNNKSIIAYGELKTSQEMTQYEKFTIDIKYRDLTKKPTYIVIVATSSKYGDYFAGSDTSLLLIDEFELGFD